MVTAQPADKRLKGPATPEPVEPDAAEAEGMPLPPPVVWAARFCVYFLAQGGIMLLAYAIKGFGTDPHSFPVGFRLDPTHSAIRLAIGLVGTYVGFLQPRYATAFMLAFAALYTLLSAFTPYHLGVQLGLHFRLLHWLLLGVVWAIGLYGLWQERRAAPNKS